MQEHVSDLIGKNLRLLKISYSRTSAHMHKSEESKPQFDQGWSHGYQIMIVSSWAHEVRHWNLRSSSLSPHRVVLVLLRYFGRSQCNDRLMVTQAHLLQLLTKGGFYARHFAPRFVYSLQWESWEMRQHRGVIREVVWSNAAYLIKMCFLLARSLHNWQGQMHKRHTYTHTHWFLLVHTN